MICRSTSLCGPAEASSKPYLLSSSIRWFGDLQPGQRDYWMFLAGNAMSWLVPPERLKRELYTLTHEVAGWHDRESKSRMHAIFERSHMAARGEKVVWEGNRGRSVLPIQDGDDHRVVGDHRRGAEANDQPDLPLGEVP